MQINDVDHGRLRRLAALHPQDGSQILSIYLDLDPAAFGTQPARAAQISSLLDEADRRARRLELDHSAKTALCKDVGRVRDYLRDDFSAKGAHAVALFASGPSDLFEVVRLSDTVPSAVAVHDTPWLDPLIGRDRPRRCIALVNRRLLRVFADTDGGGMREVAEVADEVRNQHDQGGWSQANYERSVEEDMRKHLEHAAQVLFEHYRRRPFDVLVAGAAAELWPEFERMLHPYVRERVLGRVDMDVERASADDALEAARPLLDAAEREQLGELLARLHASLANGGRAAAGLAPVLDALNERRVAALLVESGLVAPGFACPQSGWLGVDAGSCPSGEERAEPRENVVEDAIAAALLQAAEVRTLRPDEQPELGPLGRIAALLRY